MGQWFELNSIEKNLFWLNYTCWVLGTTFKLYMFIVGFYEFFKVLNLENFEVMHVSSQSIIEQLSTTNNIWHINTFGHVH
jgi:hypothetical protein